MSRDSCRVSLVFSFLLESKVISYQSGLSYPKYHQRALGRSFEPVGMSNCRLLALDVIFYTVPAIFGPSAKEKIDGSCGKCFQARSRPCAECPMEIMDDSMTLEAELISCGSTEPGTSYRFELATLEFKYLGWTPIKCLVCNR